MDSLRQNLVIASTSVLLLIFIRKSAFYFFGHHTIRWLLALQAMKSPNFRFRYEDE